MHANYKRPKTIISTMNKYLSFEEYLLDQCDTHTNNSPEGFERWLENLDGEEYMKYADEYGLLLHQLGRNEILKEWNETLYE